MFRGESYWQKGHAGKNQNPDIAVFMSDLECWPPLVTGGDGSGADPGSTLSFRLDKKRSSLSSQLSWTFLKRQDNQTPWWRVADGPPPGDG